MRSDGVVTCLRERRLYSVTRAFLPHLTHNHLTHLISQLSSHTRVTAAINLTLCELPAHVSSRLARSNFSLAGAAVCVSGATFALQAPLFVHLALLLRGRRSTLATCVLQTQHFVPLGAASARLVAGLQLLPGTCSTLCICAGFGVAGRLCHRSYFCVAGTAHPATRATFASQTQHFHTLGVASAGLRRHWPNYCVAGAALSATRAFFAWQAQTL